MRIKIIQRLPTTSADGIDLRHFDVGSQYEVGTAVAALLLAEGWARPVAPDEPPAPPPPLELPEDFGGPPTPPNLIREIFPPYYTGPDDLAADRRSRPRLLPIGKTRSIKPR